MRKDPNKITNEKREITTNTTEIQMIIREHYEKLYATTQNLEEIDQFLEIYNIAKIKNEEIRNLNRQLTSKEIESAIRVLPIGDAQINRTEWKVKTRYKHVSMTHNGQQGRKEYPMAERQSLQQTLTLTAG